jgi:serine/threonine protein phosphatase 1
MMFQASFVTLPVNRLGRDLIVGDLHGQKDLLDHALRIVNFDKEADRLIALGDLVDRGPDSEALLKLIETAPWFISVRGNHEAMLQGSRSDSSVEHMWWDSGNEWSRSHTPEQLDALAQIVDGMPLLIELSLADGRRIGLVHAEIPPNRTWADMRQMGKNLDSVSMFASNDEANLLWGRTRIGCLTHVMSRRVPKKMPRSPQQIQEALRPVPGIDLIIAGHTVLAEKEPVAVGNLLFIETGAFMKKGRLTVVDPMAGHYWQVGRLNGKPYALRHAAEQIPEPVVVCCE